MDKTKKTGPCGAGWAATGPRAACRGFRLGTLEADATKFEPWGCRLGGGALKDASSAALGAEDGGITPDQQRQA